MSFILDALKKSDKKRQESVAPGLDTVHDSAPIKSQPRQLWICILLALLLLTVGLLVWFLSFSQPAPVADVAPVQQHPEVAAKPESVAKPQSRPQPATAPQVKPVAIQPTKPVKELLPKLATPAPAVRPLAPAPDSSELGRRIYSISELPVSVQQQVPELHMSLHAYSDAGGSAGMIRVNEQILRQGSTLDGKLLLEEIRADGAIFSFKGYHFLLPPP